jgi:integrase
MAISKYTLYKYVKVASTWRYCKAAYHDNSKIKPDVVFLNVKEGLLEKHPEGRYYMSHNGGWIDAGADALEAQRKRKQRLALDEFIAMKAGAKFHTELHKLRKTGASRRYLAGVPLPTLMLELGHESLAVTQNYLADVRRPGEAKKAVSDADFVPKPKVVKTGTDGDRIQRLYGCS